MNKTSRSLNISKGERRIRQLLGSKYDFQRFEKPTRTAREAAIAIGCNEAQIGKSIIFRSVSDKPVLVVASGVNKVDQKKVGLIIGQKVKQAEPKFVREKSGYALGGVPPIGHLSTPITLLDRDLLIFERIWVAAGSAYSVVSVTPNELRLLTKAEFFDICRSSR